MQNLVTVDAASTTAPALSSADVAAHRAASHVRRTAVVEQETLTLPADTASRRRVMQQRRV
jgi:hypothetical protein